MYSARIQNPQGAPRPCVIWAPPPVCQGWRMGEHWFSAWRRAKMTGKTLPVLKKDVFPFSQFISLFIVLKAISAFSHLPTILLFPLLGVSHPHYLHSECPPTSAQAVFSSWAAHLFLASLLPLSGHAELSPLSAGLPPHPTWSSSSLWPPTWNLFF